MTLLATRHPMRNSAKKYTRLVVATAREHGREKVVMTWVGSVQRCDWGPSKRPKRRNRGDSRTGPDLQSWIFEVQLGVVRLSGS
jgi:hypothetical protein